MKYLLCFGLLLYGLSIFSQITEAPEPCSNGTENTCTCEDAPILCTIDALDGYIYSMTTFLHPEDGPSGDENMCSGPEGNGTTSHNPTWFGFLAWCEDLTIEVDYLNCVNNPNSCNALGIQVAVYEDCSLTEESAIACDTDGAGCINNSSRIINITGMNIGSTYYFLVDGCCGSACNIRINVIGSCGLEQIPEFSEEEEIIGPEILCFPTGSVNYYLEEEHIGAVNYDWVVIPVGGSSTDIDYGEDLLSVNYEFPSPGEYQICVDVDNEPCITLADAPDPNCKTILVLDEVADAGDLTATAACPNQEVLFGTENYTNPPDFEQWVFVTDASGEILFAQAGDNGSYIYDMCGSLTFYSYNFYTDADPPYTIPVVGENVSDFILCEACFCDLLSIELVWDDAEAPSFIDPPVDITVDCYDEVSTIPDLSYTDNCLASGSVEGVDNGSSDNCFGGSYTRVWTITDDCDNTETYTQNIVVDPVPLPIFLNIPGDETLSCADLIGGDVSVDYSNSSFGACLIEDSVIGVPDVAPDICGGDIAYTWTIQDACGNDISETQTVTIEPPLEIVFSGVPDDITITCDDLPFTPISLNYSNNDIGACLIDGIEDTPEISGSLLVCQDMITITWEVIDFCGRSFTEEQVVTLQDTESPVFTDPPGPLTFDCIFDVPPAEDLQWEDNCDGTGTVALLSEVINVDICNVGTIERTWEYIDNCSLDVTHTQIITLNLPPQVDWISSLPADITVECDEVFPNMEPLDYSNSVTNACLDEDSISGVEVGELLVCGDQIIRTWEYVPDCGNPISHTQTITLEDVTAPELQNEPADISIECFLDIPLMEDLDWVDNCDGNGIVPGVEMGAIDDCIGGVITRTWTYTDICGTNTDTHIQTITMDPVPDVDWLGSLPIDITVQCDEVITPAIDLDYSNAPAGANCLEFGTVIPEESGELLVCGDQIIRTWEFLNPICGSGITHTQTITLEDVIAPELQTEPADITIECFLDIPLMEDLDWVDNCDGNGIVTGVEMGAIDNCAGGVITRTWTYTDICGTNTDTHIQTITMDPVPEIDWLGSLPSDITVQCDEVITPAINLDYSNAPAGTNCLEFGTVIPEESGELLVCGDQIIRTWEFLNPICGSGITHTQTITLEDIEFPELQNEPSDIVFDCYLSLPVMQSLDWTDNCDGNGTVSGEENGTIDNCLGGSITRTWEYTDECGNQDIYTQNITVLPVPDIMWTTSLPPALIIIECADPIVIPASIDLDYSNNASNVDCEEMGTVEPIEAGALVVCGDELTRTWTTPNPQCGGLLEFVQTIILDDTTPPMFINTPNSSVTITCINDLPTTIDLEWTDNCDGIGTVPYVESGSLDVCAGGSITRTWEYTDFCGNGPVQFVQVISLIPPTPTTCDDLNTCTINDMITLDCNGTICVDCEGEVTDCTGETEFLACDDINVCTINDVIEIACDGTICTPCQGEVTDCDNGLTFQEPCSDGDPCTINDMRTVDCQNQECVPCAGTPNPTADPTLQGPAFVCEGETATLVASGCSGTVIWYDDAAGANVINVGSNFVIPPITTTVTYYALCDVNGCESNIIPITVNLVLPQEPTITGDGVICQGDVSVLDAGSGYTSYDWGSSSDQTLTVFTTGTYTVTVTDSNGCESTDDFTVMVLNPNPPNISGSLTYCIDGTTTLTVNNNYVDYLWDPNGETGNTIDVSTDGIYSITVTDTDGCTSSSSVSISESNSLNPQILGSLILCEDETTVLSVGSFATYLWSPGGENTSFINVNTSGTYSVVVSDSNGCTGESSVDMVDNLITTVQILGDDVICQGSSTNLDAFNVDYTDYLWSTGSLNPSITVSDDDDYTVQVTDINGCTSSSTISIEYFTAAILVISGDVVICPGQPTTLSAQTGYTDYLWSPGGETTSSITASASGTYSLIVTDNNSCTFSSSVNVTSQTDLELFIQGSLSYCVGSSTELDAGVWSSYLWSPNGETSQMITVGTQGVYTVEVTDVNGCQASSMVTVQEDSELSPIIGGAVLVCEQEEGQIYVLGSYADIVWSDNSTGNFILVGAGNYTVTVTDDTGCTGTSMTTITEQPPIDVEIIGVTEICQGSTTELIADSGFSDYEWSTGLTSSSIIVNQSGEYQVTVTNNLGCTADASVIVVVSVISAPEIIGETQFCINDSMNLSVSGYSGYEWSNGVLEDNTFITEGGSYSVTVTDAFGCTSSTSISIIENSLPNVQIQGSNSYCIGGFTQLSVDDSYTSILWSTGDVTSIVEVDEAGIIQVEVTDLNGCTASSSVEVIESTELSPTISGLILVCENGLTSLTADGNYPTVLWSNNAMTSTITVGPGNYEVTVTDNSGCTGSSQVTVGQQIVDQVQISGNNEFCEGFNTEIEASDGFAEYIWDGGFVGSIFTVATSGVYTVTATDDIGCTSTASIQMNTVSLDSPTIMGEEVFCEGESTMLSTTNFAMYLWSTDETTQSIEVSDSGAYTVTVTDDIGCTSSTFIQVEEQSLPEPLIVGSTSFCVGGTATLNVDQDYTLIEWSNGEMTSSIMTSEIGVTSVVVTDNLGCTGSSEVLISQEEFLSPNIGGDLVICQGETTILDGGIAFDTWLWSTDETTQTIIVDQSETYIVTVSDASGCTGSSEVVVIVLPTPDPIIVGTLELCPSASTTLFVTDTYTAYVWNTGDNSDTLLVSESGLYSVEVTDDLGCLGSTQVAVISNPNPAILDIQTICDSEMLFYNVIISTDGDMVTAGANTAIYINDQYVIENISVSTSIDIYIQNSTTQCDTSITVDPPNCDCLALSDAGPNQSIDCDVTSVILGGDETSVGSEFTYTWYDQLGNVVSNDITYISTSGGQFTLEVLDLTNDCTTLSSVTVEDKTNEPIAIIYAQPDDIIDCVIDIVTLSTDEQANVEYTWIIGKLETNDIQIDVSEESSVTLLAIDTITGCSNSSMIFIEDQEEYPLILISDPDILTCATTSVLIDASGTQLGESILYQWYDEDGPIDLEDGITLDVGIEGTFYLEAIDTTNNCTNIDSVEVLMIENYPEVMTSEDSVLPCDEDGILINVNVMTSQSVLYTWSTTEGNIVGVNIEEEISVNAAGWYYVSVEDILTGCTSYDSVYIEQNIPPNIAEQLIVQPQCTDTEGGEITMTVESGGTPPLIYTLDGVMNSTGVFTGLGAGDYLISVVDVLGCSSETTIVLNETGEVELGVDMPVINTDYGSTETVELITSVLEEDIAMINWVPDLPFDCINCLELTFENITVSQEYLVTLIDNQGCLDTTTFQFVIEQEEDIFIPNIVNPSVETGEKFYPLSGTDGVTVEDMRIYDRWGNLIFTGSGFETNDSEFGWDGTFNGIRVEPGVYVYYFEFAFPGLGRLVKAGDVTVIF